MSTLLEHDGARSAVVQPYYQANLVSANSSSLHRPQYEQSTSQAAPPQYYAEPGIANLPSMNSQMEHLDQQNVSASSRQVWCQTQLCLLTFTLSLMVALNAGLLFWILSYLNFDQVILTILAIEGRPHVTPINADFFHYNFY